MPDETDQSTQSRAIDYVLKSMRAIFRAADEIVPGKTSQRFVRYLSGFVVGTAIGAAPLLGSMALPLVNVPYDIVPGDLSKLALIFSTFLTGFAAVAVQVAADSRIGTQTLRVLFVLLSFAFLVLVAFFLLCQIWLVVRVSYQGEKGWASFTRGWNRKPPPTEGAKADNGTTNSAWTKFSRSQMEQMSDEQYIRECVGVLDPSVVTSCWPEKEVLLSRTLTIGAYLLMMFCFVGLVGLAVLQAPDQAIDQQTAVNDSNP